MRHVASRWGKEGVTANVLAPGFTVTGEMKAQMDRVRFLSSMHFPVDRLIEQHREVVEGIATGDVDRAERFMRLHLQGILADLPVIKQERPEYFL